MGNKLKKVGEKTKFAVAMKWLGYVIILSFAIIGFFSVLLFTLLDDLMI
jgi:hypothetical protein